MISAYVEQIKPIPPRIIESVSLGTRSGQAAFCNFTAGAFSVSRGPDVKCYSLRTIHPVADSADSLKDSEL